MKQREPWQESLLRLALAVVLALGLSSMHADPFLAVMCGYLFARLTPSLNNVPTDGGQGPGEPSLKAPTS